MQIVDLLRGINLAVVCILGVNFVSSCALSGTEPAKKPVQEMQKLVIEMAKFAREQKPNFIIIPQNGPELAYINGNPNNALYESYLAAIDGLAVEEIFYHGHYSPDHYRINLLDQLQPRKPIFTSEYIKDPDQIPNAILHCHAHQFICYPRAIDNYHYQLIPQTVTELNQASVTQLAQVSNYLYLINSSLFASKNVLLETIAETNFDMITIDLFFDQNTRFTTEEIDFLKTKANGGKRLVIAYLNIGAAENWRYYWDSTWQVRQPSWIAKPYTNYADEYWVQYWHPVWQNILFGNENSYLQKIIDAGFDGVMLDNVEAYYFLYHDN